MLIGVQWTLTKPQDWTWIDVTSEGTGSRRWRKTNSKPEPDGSESLDNRSGWVFDIVVQGVHIYGHDHYAIEPVPSEGEGDGVRVLGWTDDLEDEDTDYRWGEVWTFMPGWVDRTFLVNEGMLRHQGPDQRKVIYTEPAGLSDFGEQYDSAGLVPVLDWSEFPTPVEQITRHGVWVRDDALWRSHFERRRAVDWREWL